MPPPARIETERLAAAARGDGEFATEYPCPHGHRLRQTKTGRCIPCLKFYVHRYRVRPENKTRALELQRAARERQYQAKVAAGEIDPAAPRLRGRGGPGRCSPGKGRKQAVVVLDGQSIPLATACEILNVSVETVYKRRETWKTEDGAKTSFQAIIGYFAALRDNPETPTPHVPPAKPAKTPRTPGKHPGDEELPVTLDGETVTLLVACERLGIPIQQVFNRRVYWRIGRGELVPHQVIIDWFVERRNDPSLSKRRLPVGVVSRPRGKPRPPFVDNDELLAEVLRAQDRQRSSNRLGAMLLLMAKKYVRRYNLVHYTFRDEMEETCLFAMLGAIPKFDRTKGSNPFAYLTSVMRNACLRVLAAEEKQRQIIADTRDITLIDELA